MRCRLCLSRYLARVDDLMSGVLEMASVDRRRDIHTDCIVLLCNFEHGSRLTDLTLPSQVSAMEM